MILQTRGETLRKPWKLTLLIQDGMSYKWKNKKGFLSEEQYKIPQVMVVSKAMQFSSFAQSLYKSEGF